MVDVLVTSTGPAPDLALRMSALAYGVRLHFCQPSAAQLLQQLQRQSFGAVIVQDSLCDLRRSALVQQYRMRCGQWNKHLLLPAPEPLFFTVLPSHDINARCMLLEAGYADVLFMPYSAYRLAQTVLQKLRPQQSAYLDREEGLRLYYGSLLRQMGAPGNLKGTAYLAECLVYLSAQPDAVYQVTKVLYPQVAEKMNTSADNLERSMRTAVRQMLQQGDRQAIDAYLTPLFGCGTRASVSRLLAGLLQYTLQHRDRIGCK